MRIAVIGASGLVGKTILKLLEERNISISEMIPVASTTSIGKEVYFKNNAYKLIGISDALAKKPDIAIFSAGKSVSIEWAEKFATNGTFVVDNSSAWRMHKDIKLIVPEVNRSILTSRDKIISNPNCSTIQLAVVLWPLHKLYGLKRVIVSTYQSVTGSGVVGVKQLMNERSSKPVDNPAYPYQIDLNCIPHGGIFLENQYTEEEWKLVAESKKILNIKNLKLTATVARIPVLGGHSESVNIEFFEKPDITKIFNSLRKAEGVTVLDNPKDNIYPMPIISEGKDETFVGRIRLDNSCENAVNLWITADNLRKGAATNAVQIAEYIYNNIITVNG